MSVLHKKAMLLNPDIRNLASEQVETREHRLHRKTLVVTWSLPPALIGSSQIISSLANAFSSKEMVLAGERWPGPRNNQWDDGGGLRPEIHFVHKQWPFRFQRTVRLFLFPIVLWRLWRVFKRTGCQQVLGIFPNEYYLFAAYCVARWAGVPFYSYFHNTYLDNRRGIKRLFAKWFQPKVFEASKIIFVMSDGMKEFLEPAYPGRQFVPLVHTFDETIPETPANKPIGTTLKLAFMGSVNESNREAMSRFAPAMARLDDCVLTTYSGSPESEFAKIGLPSSNKVVHKRVAFHEVTTALREHDILLLPHGFHGGLNQIEYETIFPTRTTGYLVSGIPVIAHSPKNSFLSRWLKEHDCAEIVDSPDVNQLVAAIQRLRKDNPRRQQIAQNALNASRQFLLANVVQRFRDSINKPKSTATLSGECPS